ncbi:MAG: hypothetical protein COB07_13100 [Sulfurovum sp.]|nr:MAG: hypothetical protein COB07_13100 [Sulfurovum sp.]
MGSNFIEQLAGKSSAAEYILENPPMKQVVNEHNQVVWQQVPNNDRSVQTLFGHISRVRNNLFHGAKFNGTWYDPDRSRELMKHALIVLMHFKDKVE